LTIDYSSSGFLHRHELVVDRAWNVLKRVILDQRPDLHYDKPNKFKPILKILHNNEHLISLSSHDLTVDRKQFVKVLQELPLIKFFLGFENAISLVKLTREVNSQDFTSTTSPTKKIAVPHEQILEIAVFNDQDKIVNIKLLDAQAAAVGLLQPREIGS